MAFATPRWGRLVRLGGPTLVHRQVPSYAPVPPPPHTHMQEGAGGHGCGLKVWDAGRRVGTKVEEGRNQGKEEQGD